MGRVSKAHWAIRFFFAMSLMLIATSRLPERTDPDPLQDSKLSRRGPMTKPGFPDLPGLIDAFTPGQPCLDWE